MTHDDQKERKTEPSATEDNSYYSSAIGKDAADRRDVKKEISDKAGLRTSIIRKETEEISFKEFVIKLGEWGQYLLSKWLIILMAGGIGCIGGIIYAYFDEPIYNAEITFVLEEENSVGSSLGQFGGLVGLAGISGGGGGLFEGDNIFHLYKSKSMIEKTLLTPVAPDSILLVQKYITFNKLEKKWAKDPALLSMSISEDAGNRLRDSVMIKITDDIINNYLVVARPDRKLGIISVKVSAKNEIFAKEFSEKLVENVNQYYIDTKTKKSLQTLNILKWQTDSVRAVLNGAIYSVGSTMDATPNLNPARQILRAPVQRSQMDVEANSVMLTELVKNLELAKMSLRRETPLIQVIDKPVFPLQIVKARKVTSMIYGGILSGMLTLIFLFASYFLKTMFKE